MAENKENIRTIIHIDMDAFYASVEMLEDPDLKGKPVVVGGLSERSVVSAASYEARRYGIHSAMPTLTARKLCPKAIFLPVRMHLYREVSEHIMAIFHRFSPLVEPISLDEAFIDVSDSGKLFGSGVEIATRIREMIKSETGLTASAGIATSKLLAKIASDLDKPDGMTIVDPGREREFLSNLPISKLWGVGKNTLNSLKMLNIESIGDLAAFPLEVLTAKYGKQGRHMHYSARGIDERQVIPVREAKSIGHEDTFSEDIRDIKTIREKLLSLATRVGRRIRRHDRTAKTISVKVKFNDFSTNTRSITLKSGTDDSREIYQQASLLLKKTAAGRRPLRLLGISISNLGKKPGEFQQDLFGDHDQKEKESSLNRAIDELNLKFGSKTVVPAPLIKK